MPIFLNGSQYEDEAHLEAAFNPMLKNMGVDVKPLPPKTGDDVDSKMVVTPNQMDTNKQLEAQDDAVLGGTEISNRIYVGRTPLGSSTEPAGEFKLRGGTEIPSYGEQGYTAISEPPKPDLEKEYLKRLAGTDSPRPAGDILWDVLKNVNDKVMNAIKLPGDAWQGNVDPMSEEGIQRATDLAGLVVLGGVGRTLDAASQAGVPSFRPNPIRLDKSLQDKLIDGTATQAEIAQWQQHPLRPSAEDFQIADEVAKILKEMDKERPPVKVQKMSEEEVAKMKESWGKQDIYIPANQHDAYIDMFVKQPTIAKADKLPEKMTPKEAFLQAVEDTSAAFGTAVANIKKQFIEAAREPLTSVPNLKKAAEKGYDTPAYRGIVTAEGQAPNSVYHFGKAYNEMFSTESPLLAEMYAGFLGSKTKAPRPSGPVYEDEFFAGAQVKPLLINTKDYHVFDAKGKSWQFVNDAAIQEAKKLGKPGIIMQNVWDEPGSTTYLGTPKTVYITLPNGASTVKSRFAKNFDPSSPDMLNSIAAIGMVGAAGAVAFQTTEPLIPELPHK